MPVSKLTNEIRLNKNASIKQSTIETRIRRKSQVCRVYKCKIQDNKLTVKQKEQLDMMFIEAKWLYNDILNWSMLSEENKPWEYKIGKTVHHYNKDKEYVESELKYIHSQMKQDVQKYLCANIRTLSTLKKKGLKIGKLKFKTEINRLHVKQTSLERIKCKKGKLCKLPNISGLVHVNGLNQFINKQGIELACFDILKTPKGYYIAFCTYQDKKYIKQKKHNNKTIGIDFGCSTNFTTSEGEKISTEIKESDRLIKLQRQLSRKRGFRKGEKKSNNFKKLCLKIKREYQRMSDIKNDTANKIANHFLEYDTIVIQDEQLSKWQENGYGKQVQHSIMGRIKRRLLESDNVIVLNKYVPTTKLCTNCGTLNEMPVNKRKFKCKNCNVVEDRDIHAAQTMVWMYKHNVGVGRTKLKPMEINKQLSNIFNYDILEGKH